MLGKVALIMPYVHIVKLGRVAGLDLDLLRHLAAGKDPVALQRAEDGLEIALLHPVEAFQCGEHLPVGGRISQVHIK